MADLYNLPNIRELLTNGFSDAELRALCFDYFRPVYDQLAQNTGKAEIVHKLIEHTENTSQLGTLLALAKEKNPARYDRHQPYYTNDPVPALQKEVAILTDQVSILNSLVLLDREKQYQVALRWVELGRRNSLADFDLSERNLIGVDLMGVDLRRAKLIKANLAAANLSEADLRGADLELVNLSGADLSNADLRLAKLARANLTKANLVGARLDEAVLSDDINEGYRTSWLPRAKLTKADLENANFNKTNSQGANLSEANLTGSSLREAKLKGANLCRADLTDADLRGNRHDFRGSFVTDLTATNLEETILNGVKYNHETKWPEGFDPSKAGVIYED